jgi:hypothetical protein
MSRRTSVLKAHAPLRSSHSRPALCSESPILGAAANPIHRLQQFVAIEGVLIRRLEIIVGLHVLIVQLLPRWFWLPVVLAVEASLPPPVARLLNYGRVSG